MTPAAPDLFLFYTGPFSQWHRSPFVVGGVAFNCTEQFMMYNKALLFGDNETAAQILMAATPRQQKSLGRRVQGFNDRTWNLFKEGVVFTANLAKFSQDEGLRADLLATGDKIIVEASPTDRIWGIGLAEDDPRALDVSQWQGSNLLGLALMRVRTLLRGGDPGILG